MKNFPQIAVGTNVDCVVFNPTRAAITAGGITVAAGAYTATAQTLSEVNAGACVTGGLLVFPKTLTGQQRIKAVQALKGSNFPTTTHAV